MRMTLTNSCSITRSKLRRGAVRAVSTTLLAVAACGGGGDGITSSTSVASIRFVTPPGNIGVNQSFSVQVELLSSGGTRITTATSRVTLTASGATLSGTTVVDAVEGLAAFSGLSFTTAGASVTLTAEAAGRSVTSPAFAAMDPCTPLTLTLPGTVSGTVQENSCLVSGTRAVVYRFTAPPSGASAFSVTAQFPSRFDVATNPPGTNVGLSIPAGQPLLAEWLLPNGTFLFRVGATSGTGTFSVTATNPPGNTGCVVRLLATGGSFVQSLANGDCLYDNVPNWFEDLFPILSNLPCTITLSSTQFDAYLELRDLSGNVQFEDDDSGGGLNSRISLPQCNFAGNAVVIAANSLSPGESGAYTLTVALTGSEAAPDIMLDAPTVMPSVSPVRAASPRQRPPKR